MILWQYPPQAGITISSPPIQYELNGAAQTVIEDTVTPANNRTLPVHDFYILNGVQTPVNVDSGTPANTRAFPSMNYIMKDGNQVFINKDTGVPANTVGVPVEIVAASGTPINITAGDINVQLTDMGVNYDRTRIGDGSARQLTLKDGLNVAGDYATIVSEENLKNAVALLGAAFPTSTVMAGVKDSANLVADMFLDTNNNLRVANKDPINFTLDGTTSDVMQDTLTPANSNPLPVVQLNSAGVVVSPALDYGVSTTAHRTASQIGNTTGEADFNDGVSGTQTLRVSANMMRDGNDLDYNTGVAGANTPRIVLATRHEDVATPLSFRKGNGTAFDDYDDGVSGANTPRVSANVKFEGVEANLGLGTGGVATQRIILDSRSEAALTPLSSRISDGTNFNSVTAPIFSTLTDGVNAITAVALAAAQFTVSTVVKMLHVVSITMGWDGTTHRELAVDTSGQLKIVDRKSVV